MIIIIIIIIIIINGTDPKCRLCHEFDESLEHIMSDCPVLAKKEYLERHDKALTYIHWNICKYYQIQVTSKWYEHKPSKVAEGKDVTILWDMPINTEKEIKADRPDIVIKDKSKNLCTLIDIAVPSERNVATEEVEKICKIQRSRNGSQQNEERKNHCNPSCDRSPGTH